MITDLLDKINVPERSSEPKAEIDGIFKILSTLISAKDNLKHRPTRLHQPQKEPEHL